MFVSRPTSNNHRVRRKSHRFLLGTVYGLPPLPVIPHMDMRTAIGSVRQRRCRRFVPFIAFALLALPSSARASIFHGETLDAIANGISWVVLIIGPIIG